MIDHVFGSHWFFEQPILGHQIDHQLESFGIDLAVPRPNCLRVGFPAVWTYCFCEDIPYLAEYIGEDHLMIGSDYGHNDPAEEKALVETMKAREDLSAALVDKILVQNPKDFYSI